MDLIEFMSYNNEFKIRLQKKKKIYSSHPYTKYECSISFINTLNQPVLVLKCSEKEFVNSMESLHCFDMNMGNTFSDQIYFTSDYDNPCFIFISALESITDNPIEEEMLQFSIYEVNKNNQGNILRLYMEMSYYYLEELVYQMYNLINDIPYLSTMMNSSLLELIEGD